MKQWKGKIENSSYGHLKMGGHDLLDMLCSALYGKDSTLEITADEEEKLEKAEWQVTIGGGSVVISRVKTNRL